MRAGNVVLFQYLDKQVLNRSGTGFSSSESITIEHLIPPVKEFAGTALASGPFSLPKVPAEVEQYWAFKSSAGGAPSLPALMFQLYTLPVYAEFRKLIGQVAPKLIQNLPADDAAILRDKNLSDVVADIRQLFSMHPNLAGKMFAQLAGSQITHADRKNDNYLAALIKMYAASDSRFLNFYGPARSIATISYHRVLEAARNNKKNVPAMDFNGKAVFIGLSEPIQLDQVDTFYTPYSLANGVDISGVEIMATAFANMVDGTEVQPLNAMDMIILLLAWGVIISIIGRLLPTGWAIAMTLTIAGSYLYISVHYFGAYNRWLPLVTPLLLQTPFALFGSLVWRYKETNRERKKIRNAFGFYLPDYVIDEISNIKADGNDKPLQDIIINKITIT